MSDFFQFKPYRSLSKKENLLGSDESYLECMLIFNIGSPFFHLNMLLESSRIAWGP